MQVELQTVVGDLVSQAVAFTFNQQITQALFDGVQLSTAALLCEQALFSGIGKCCEDEKSHHRGYEIQGHIDHFDSFKILSEDSIFCIVQLQYNESKRYRCPGIIDGFRKNLTLLTHRERQSVHTGVPSGVQTRAAHGIIEGVESLAEPPGLLSILLSPS